MKRDHESDERLMQQVAGGCRDCLELIIRRYANPLLTFIQRMTGDQHRSEELFQDVFLAVWLKRKQYQPPRPFRAWLFAIAANRCRADFRRPRLVHVDDERATILSLDKGESPVEAAIATETERLVATAVGNLPARQRSVVVLRVWNGMAYAEIAQILGRSETTIRSHMHHGLAAMRRYLEPRLKV